MGLSQVKKFFIGEPLSTHRMAEEKIPKWKALAVLSSDALSSTAYATEEILLPLAAVSVIAVAWTVPIATAISVLLLIVALSYLQTVAAYPNGGGAYVVAKENLGLYPGLIAGASLMIDYVLTVAVSIAAGVSAITSAFPELFEHRIAIGILVIAILSVLNLRGIRESATIFAFPTYIFIFSFFVMLGLGALRLANGEAERLQPVFHSEYPEIATFLILRAFSSGCAALTGIEAISNAVPSFRRPQIRNARITLGVMAGILCILFFGITAMSHVYQIMPVEGETAVSQLAKQIVGEGWFYYLIQISTAFILFLAANTSYSGFPWLAAVLAKDRYLPRQFAVIGDRLVYSNSIIGLGVSAAILLVIFQGQTHSLIPLYAVGVFLGFTLSQSGMVRYHLRERRPKWQLRLLINFLGAVTTFVVMLVIAATKFAHGAWIVVALIPCFVWFFTRINGHYLNVGKQLSLTGVSAPDRLDPFSHTVVVPISGVHRGVINALRYGLGISDDVRAVYIEIDAIAADRMKKEWEKWGHEVPLVVLKSDYRSVIKPLLDYLDDLEQTHHRDMITVIIPEFVTAKWWQNFLHNQTAFLIRAALLFRRRKVVTSVRYHLT